MADTIDEDLILNHMHRRWIDTLSLAETQKDALKRLSREYLALSGREPTVAQRKQLRDAAREFTGPSSDGSGGEQPGPSGASQAPGRVISGATELERIILSELQSDSHGSLTSGGLGGEQPGPSVASQLPGRMEHDALLPSGLDYLLQDSTVLTGAHRRQDGVWKATDGREYVKLEVLSEVQVVETVGSDQERRREIVTRSTNGEIRPTGRALVKEGARWVPVSELRDGFALFPSSERAVESFRISLAMPSNIGDDVNAMVPFTRSIPQPLLRLFGGSIVSGNVGKTGMELTVRRPETGQPVTFSTHLDREGRPLQVPDGSTERIARVSPPSPRQATPFEMKDSNMPTPESTNEIALSEMDWPISTFIKIGTSSAHIDALVNTRRMRGMVREDTHMVLVGSTYDHVFTLIMPVNADALDFAEAGADGARTFDNLPQGTLIVDDVLGITEEAGKYCGAVDTKTTLWGLLGMTMKHPNGPEKAMHDFGTDLKRSNVHVDLWNPASDPISEVRYVEYLRRRHRGGEPVSHAGLDWLQTQRARRDYMGYFSPPYDRMPGHVPPVFEDDGALKMYRLAKTILNLYPIAAGQQ